MRIELKQKEGSVNCYSVAAAMALNMPLKEVEESLFPAVAPYSDRDIYKLMLDNGYFVGCIIETPTKSYNDLDEFTKTGFYYTLKDNEAFIVVDSETKPKPTTHAIYWDGNKVYDPNPLCENGRCLKSYAIINILPINKL